MAVYAIGDLHLPGSDIKPMDVFGTHWEHHFERICDDWCARVSQSDIVLLPGDFSWAMTLNDAKGDIASVGKLPGRKIMVRGNHDFWWSSLTQVRETLPEGMYVLQNDSLKLDGTVYCGTRGWTITQDDDERHEQDRKIYRREVIRLEMALKSAKRVADGADIVVLMHYPPFDEKQRPSGFTDLLESYGVKQVVYGHLHGQSLRGAFSGLLRGVNYYQVSCDGLGFKLLKLPDIQCTYKEHEELSAE